MHLAILKMKLWFVELWKCRPSLLLQETEGECTALRNCCADSAQREVLHRAGSLCSPHLQAPLCCTSSRTGEESPPSPSWRIQLSAEHSDLVLPDQSTGAEKVPAGGLNIANVQPLHDLKHLQPGDSHPSVSLTGTAKFLPLQEMTLDEKNTGYYSTYNSQN